MKRPKLVVVIPAYRVEARIGEVVRTLPPQVDAVVIVEDASPDGTLDVARALAQEDPRVECHQHPANKGVGGAMKTGYRRALELGADIVVKVDGDGQMDPDHLPALIHPLLTGEADYTKGNRFYHLDELRAMPALRLLGNGVLGFLVRAASGYWNVYDPTNGYTAIQAPVLRQLNLERVSDGYFFEGSMLIELGLVRAVVRDVPIPARYGDEISSLDLGKTLLQFPLLLLHGLLRRVWQRHILHELTVTGVFLAFGLALLGFGVVFGGVHWIQSIRTGVVASTGTVMLAALPATLGFILLVQAIAFDVVNVPQKVLSHADRPPPPGPVPG